MKAYLSGGIFPTDRIATDGWREAATNLLTKAGFQVLNPCRGKATYQYGYHTPNEIVLRDLKDVDAADIVLMNFVDKPNKLFTGTQMELMYAWEKRKPVVVVTSDPRLTQHPWIQAMSVRIFKDLSEAVTYITDFWGEKNETV